MVKTQQLMRFEMSTIPALDDKIRGVFAIFCHLRSRVNLIFLTLVANYRNSATNEPLLVVQIDRLVPAARAAPLATFGPRAQQAVAVVRSY